jgi:hypothetical protein
MNKLLKQFLLMLLISVVTMASFAQNETANEATYRKVITERADKIVAQLGIADSAKYKRVRTAIANQYKVLNTHHEQKDAEIKVIKEKYKEDKLVLDSKIKTSETDYDHKLSILHKKYISGLSSDLSETQITKVKDVMTYNVLPITYKAYQEMLPQLTNVQKEKILGFLTEAREHAMDASSSHAKHAWFGKYKGRINNYLSAEGVDMKKAGVEWQERIKAEKASGAKK